MGKRSDSTLINGIKNKDAAAMGRAISIVENNAPLKNTLLKKLASNKTNSLLIGITGSQGAGKSTLIASLAKRMREKKKKVAIIAVDPTSPKSGGAFLGDRIRMQALSDDSGVFIRSMASRGALGGVAKATRDAAFICSKAGFDFVIIETVGAGQLDYAVTKFVDLTLLVLTPEAGDEMQFMKAGLRELADVFIINKSDRPGAKQMEDFIKRSGKTAVVFKTIAEQGVGTAELCEYLMKHSHDKKNIKSHKN